MKGKLTGVSYWTVDDTGRGWFYVDNEQVVNPDWADGYWLLNGFENEPLSLTRFAEDQLGLKIEPFDGE